MTITEKDRAKAKEFAAQLQSMAVWLTSLGSSTEPGEVECVCVHGGKRCRKKVEGTRYIYICTRAEGHEGPCVACGGKREHDLTGALKRESESIDLGENNPDVRPEWWRELGHLEVIEAGDAVKRQDGEWRYTKCSGELYETRAMRRPDSGLLCHLPHYRLRPWRDMEEREMYQGGDEYYHRKQNVWKRCVAAGYQLKGSRYRTRRPKPEKYGGYVPPECLASEPEKPELTKEPDLRLPDGTDISGWPVIEEGEMVYKTDAVMHPKCTKGLWVESFSVEQPYQVSMHPYKRPEGIPFWQYRRRVLPCRHCGCEAKFYSGTNNWCCVGSGCHQQGPNEDRGAVKWNEQNRKEEV